MDRFVRFVASDGFTAFFLALSIYDVTVTVGDGAWWWAAISVALAVYWISQGGLKLYARAAGRLCGQAYSLGRRAAGLV